MAATRGLTLIEMLIALVVMAVLFGMIVPLFTTGLEAAHATDARINLLASLTLAAHKAAMIGMPTVMCPSADYRECLDTPDWSGGWLVFVDEDGSRELEAGESLLKAQAPLRGKVHLRSTVGRTRVVFQSNGGNAGSNVTFTLCDARGPSKAQALVLDNYGALHNGEPNPSALALTCPS
jgi:type IV fimbrial biogenesis protein FimT